MNVTSERTRSLARLVHIDSIGPIPEADAIELAQVGGWRVVVKKSEFAPGDMAIYVEIDAFLPEGNPAWQFLVDKSGRSYDGRRGHVLRSVKLRGQVSQGLLLNVSALAGVSLSTLEPGTDVGETLGIIKYEPSLPASLSGIALAAFPSRVPKTDQERIQNLAPELEAWKASALVWEVTEKLEGSSCTFAWLDGVLHVCSRTIDLADTPENSLWAAARALDLPTKFSHLCPGRDLAFQGELVGHGIQGNIYGLKQQKFFLYDVYDVGAGRYLGSEERRALAATFDIQHVPLINGSFAFSSEVTTETLLALADGPSALQQNQAREGLVFKALTEQVSFKAISNRYLLKQKD